MSKAEDRALEAYPKATRDINGIVVDIGHPQYMRDLYIEGYHQAEQDLALTWEDIETIGELRLNVALELRKKELQSSIKAPLKFTTEDMCKEVLKRFKDLKK